MLLTSPGAGGDAPARGAPGRAAGGTPSRGAPCASAVARSRQERQQCFGVFWEAVCLAIAVTYRVPSLMFPIPSGIARTAWL